MGSAEQENQYPFRMLGQTGKGLVRKKRIVPRVCLWNQGFMLHGKVGTVWLLRVRACTSLREGAQSRKKALARATPGRRGGKIWFLATRS